METIKDRILEILQERNISISEFCKTANIGKNAIYELDNSTPNLTNILKMADTLKISLDYIAGLTENAEFNLKSYNLNFYENLKQELKIQHISQNKFMHDLNYSTDAFTRWKYGAVPHFSTLIEISKYLNTSIDYLIGRSKD